MKAKLLSLGYCGVKGIQFPVEVEVIEEMWYGDKLYALSTEEIVRIGGNPAMFTEGDTYPLVEREFELLKEQPKIQVRLLTTGLYNSMATVELGTVFQAGILEGVDLDLAIISREDLIKAGADGDYFTAEELCFFIGSEVEIVE